MIEVTVSGFLFNFYLFYPQVIQTPPWILFRPNCSCPSPPSFLLVLTTEGRRNTGKYKGRRKILENVKLPLSFLAPIRGILTCHGWFLPPDWLLMPKPPAVSSLCHRQNNSFRKRKSDGIYNGFRCPKYKIQSPFSSLWDGPSCGFMLLRPCLPPPSPSLLCPNHPELLSCPSQTGLTCSAFKNSALASSSAWNCLLPDTPLASSLTCLSILPQIILSVRTSLGTHVAHFSITPAPLTLPHTSSHLVFHILYSLFIIPLSQLEWKLCKGRGLATAFPSLSPLSGTVPELGIKGQAVEGDG